MGGVAHAVPRGAAHRLHQGQHRHLEELLGGGEGVAEEGDVVGDGGDVEAAGELRDVGLPYIYLHTYIIVIPIYLI